MTSSKPHSSTVPAAPELSEYLQMKQKYTLYHSAVAKPSARQGSLYSYEVSSSIRRQQAAYFQRKSQPPRVPSSHQLESAESCTSRVPTVSHTSPKRRVKKAKTLGPCRDMSPVTVYSVELPQRSPALYSEVNKHYRLNTLQALLDSLQRDSPSILRRTPTEYN